MSYLLESIRFNANAHFTSLSGVGALCASIVVETIGAKRANN